MFPVEAIHQYDVHEDQDDEDVDGALLGEPETERESGAWNADRVELLDKQDSRSVRDKEPNGQ